MILWGLEHGLRQDELIEKFGEGLVRRVAALYEVTQYMRGSLPLRWG